MIRIKAADLPRPSAAEVRRLKRLTDADIDRSDIGDLDLTGAARPRMDMISLRLDRELLAWFKQAGPGYQTRMRQALWEFAQRQQRGDPQAEAIAAAVVRRLRRLNLPRPRRKAG